MGKNRIDIGLLLLRVVTGLFMSFGHGIVKIPPSERWINGVSELGFPIPSLFAWMAGISEFFGGLFIAAGLFTRPFAFLWMCTMGTAAFIRHADDPFSGKEKALIYFTIGLVLILTGPGKYNISKCIFKKSNPLL